MNSVNNVVSFPLKVQFPKYQLKHIYEIVHYAVSRKCSTRIYNKFGSGENCQNLLHAIMCEVHAMLVVLLPSLVRRGSH